MTAVSPANLPPPEPPRPLGARARRRSWAEPSVRGWSIIAAIVLACGITVGIGQWISWRHDTRLAREGVLVQATLIGADMTSRKGETVGAGQEGFLRFIHAGKEHVVHGRVPPGEPTYYINGVALPMRIDPDHPEDWTLREKVPTLVQEMIGPIILLPLGIIAGLLAAWARWRILTIWRQGTAREVIVLDSRQTALAPSSRILRCANVQGSDKRIFNVLIAKSSAPPVDHTLWVVSPSTAMQPALPVAAYQ